MIAHAQDSDDVCCLCGGSFHGGYYRGPLQHWIAYPRGRDRALYRGDRLCYDCWEDRWRFFGVMGAVWSIGAVRRLELISAFLSQGAKVRDLPQMLNVTRVTIWRDLRQIRASLMSYSPKRKW